MYTGSNIEVIKGRHKGKKTFILLINKTLEKIVAVSELSKRKIILCFDEFKVL